MVSVLNKQRKPRNILLRVCLLIFGLLSLVLFWQLTREWGVLWKGAFYKIPGLACRPTILHLGLHAARHFLIPCTGGAFAPLGPFLCPTTEEKKWLIAPKSGL
jgi:hypothetical protein